MASLTVLASEQPVWRLDLLGRFELARDGEVVARFEARREEELLAHLALHAPESVPRTVIAADLWPQLDASAARKQVSYNLFVLRKRLAELGLEDGVLDVGRRLALAPHIEVDVSEFDQEVAAAAASASVTARILALEQASMLYEGELLAGMDAAWVEPHRARMAAAHKHTMHLLAEATHGEASLQALMAQTPPGVWRRSRVAQGTQGRESASVQRADPAPPTSPGRVDVDAVARFTIEAGAGLAGAEHAEWRRRVNEREQEIEAALETALEDERYALAYDIAVPLWRYWYAVHDYARGLAWIERVRGAPYVPDLRTRAQALHAAGTLAHYDNQSRRALRLLRQANDLWEELSDEESGLRTTNNIATVYYHLGDLEGAQEMYHEANARAESLGDVRFLIGGLLHEAICAGRRGDTVTSRRLSERRLALLGGEEADPALALASLLEIGVSNLMESRLDEALPVITRAIRIAEEVEDEHRLSIALLQRGMLEYRRGSGIEALPWMRQALLAARRSGNPIREGMALGYIACALELAGDEREAARTMLRATTILRSTPDRGAIRWLQDGVRDLTSVAVGKAAG